MTGTQTATVAVDLGGELVTMIANLPAATAISRQFGGISAGYDRLARVDVDAIVFVIAAGTGKHDAQALKALSAKVYEAGISSLIGPCTEFLGLLMTGGRRVDPAA